MRDISSCELQVGMPCQIQGWVCGQARDSRRRSGWEHAVARVAARLRYYPQRAAQCIAVRGTGAYGLVHGVATHDPWEM